MSVGADGLLVVKNSNVADIEMVYYNSDGSRAAMCGNGLRCFCRFVYDNHMVNEKEFDVDTLAGIKHVTINTSDLGSRAAMCGNGLRCFCRFVYDNHMVNEKEFDVDTLAGIKHVTINTSDLGDVINIKVDMGEGSFKTSDIPMATDKEKFIEEKVHILDRDFTMTSMLMGVPHTIVFVDEFNLDMIEKYGPAIENCDLFPEKTNVNFVKVRDKYNINVYTWERGCGYTLGCGTGMTAAAVVCNYLEKTEKSMNVTSKGGTVKIDIGDKVFMTGPAVKICEGYLEV